MVRMISLRQAVEETGLSYHFLRGLCLSGDVKSVRSGTKFYLNYRSLMAFCGEPVESGECDAGLG